MVIKFGLGKVLPEDANEQTLKGTISLSHCQTFDDGSKKEALHGALWSTRSTSKFSSLCCLHCTLVNIQAVSFMLTGPQEKIIP